MSQFLRDLAQLLLIDINRKTDIYFYTTRPELCEVELL